jgi:hypothetical protein
MERNERTRLDAVVERAVKQSEARVNAKVTELRTRLQQDRAKLVGQLSPAQGTSRA